MTDVTIPSVGESITSVFIARWLVQPGAAVAVGDSLLEIDSDKASLEVPSPVAGVVRELVGEEGDEVAIGAVVARIEEGAEVAGADPAEAAAPAAAPAAPSRSASGPAARQLAQQTGVDIAAVSGGGTRGRVRSQDVAASSAGPASAGPAPAGPAPAGPVEGEARARVERRPMSPLRRTIARRLVAAQQTAAILTTFNEVDLGAIKALRSTYQDRFVERHGIKLGFMSFFVRAACEALKEFPAVNAEIDGDDVIYKRYYNIGVAVSTPRGLVVPVIRDADQLSFAGVEQAIRELGARAREGALSLADFRDGTFTISNGGIFGSMMSTPILNPPQVGILGMHAIQERPVNYRGQIALRPMMYLALSYDHRIIDGKEAVRFLVRIKELVEAPERLLLDV